MGQDIAEITEGWEYDPNEVRARWIEGADGSRKLQLRLDLGVFQMEPDGRPDGTQPHRYPSLLEYYLAEERKRTHGVLAEPLDADACSGLQQEAMQFYYRIMACHALAEWERVRDDSDHALDLIDLASEYAADDETAWHFSQMFPYMRMMNARALAEIAMSEGNYAEAAKQAQEAVDEIEGFYKENYDSVNEDGSEVATPGELISVRELLAEVEKRRPMTETESLQRELARAIELENYERAAQLRDKLKGLKGFGHTVRGGAKKRPRAGGGGSGE